MVDRTCRPMSQAKKEIAKAKFITGETIAAIADAIGVSRRTIERWADEGDWRSLRSAATEQPPNVVTLKPKSPESRAASTQFTHPPIARRISQGDLDDIEIIENAIATLSGALAGEVPPQSLGAIAGGIVKLIELRLKLQPKTAANVAQMVLDLKLNRQEFMSELRAAWAAERA